jgi:hypothetical protein
LEEVSRRRATVETTLPFSSTDWAMSASSVKERR